MCNRLKSVNSKRNIWRFFHLNLTTFPLVRKYHHPHHHRNHQLTSLLSASIVKYINILLAADVIWNNKCFFSLCRLLCFFFFIFLSLFYLFTFSIFIFIHSRQLGLPLSEQLIFMWWRAGETRTRGSKTENLNQFHRGRTMSEKKDGKIFPLNAHTA